MLILEGRLGQELLTLALKRSPFEAVGLILSDERIVELSNYAKNPESRFEVHREDLAKVLANETDPEVITFWHSHPSGGVGPSRTDMQQKTPFGSHLVIALVDGEIIPTWY